MASSFAFVSILLLLTSLSIANHAIIRAIRAGTDQRAENGAPMADRPPLGFYAIRTGTGRLNRLSQQSDRRTGVKEALRILFGWLMAFFFDIVQRTEQRIETFPKWRELPFAYGKWSTALFIIGTALVLSDDFLLGELGISFKGSSPDFCAPNDFDTKLDMFEVEVMSMTNLPLARQQHRHTTEFHKALVADTALYGVGEFACPDLGTLPGNKSDWADPTQPPASRNGPFFPGYCAAALEASIESAKTETCTRKKCACISKKIWKRNVRCCWCGEVCIDVPYACPRHADEEETELRNYRILQLEKSEQQQLAMLNNTLPTIDEEVKVVGTETSVKILKQVDAAGNLYALYSALALFFPSPLNVFRPPIGVIIKEHLFGVQKPVFILFVVALWWGIEYFQMIFFSPEIRFYVGSILHDPCILDGDYIAARQEIVSNICEELVPMGPEFSASATTIKNVLREVEFFVNSCKCSFPNRHLIHFETPQHISTEYATEIGFGVEVHGLCSTPGCTFMSPNEDIAFFGNTTLCADTDFATRLVSAPTNLDTSWWELWFASGLLAQLMIKFVAVNFVVALYRWADPLSSCGGRCLMPPSSLFEKTAPKENDDTNFDHESRIWKFVFGPSRENIRSADPLIDLREENKVYLRIISRKWTFLWGFLTVSCLINLIFSIWKEERENSMGTNTEDVLSLFCLAVAVVAIPFSIYLRLVIKKRMEFDPPHIQVNNTVSESQEEVENTIPCANSK